MNIVLLSGGSGKRLWPLSNDIRSKQFIKIFHKPGTTDEYESMVQRMYRQIRMIDPDAKITIATGKSQISALRNQLGDDVDISPEPCRRDTFPAIALAAAYLHDQKHVPYDESVVICPVDPLVDEDYFEALKELWTLAGTGYANLYLMGIQPTYPSEKYGYILPETEDKVSGVSAFKEKPDVKMAQNYIDQGGLWNGGIFACRLSYLLKKSEELTGYLSYDELYDHYSTLPKISFDYAVVEKEKHISVMLFKGQWKDLGTWNTLSEAMDEKAVGNVRFDNTCKNVHVVNELDVPILAIGLKDVVIAASPEGVLVSDKGQSSFMKPLVDAIDQPVMFAEKSWGSYRVIDVGERSLTVKVTLNPGHGMNYHSHEYRDEVWTVVKGTGIVILDGEERHVRSGDVISMPAGCKHTVIADTELQIIEVQLGNDIRVTDKRKYTCPTN